MRRLALARANSAALDEVVAEGLARWQDLLANDAPKAGLAKE